MLRWSALNYVTDELPSYTRAGGAAVVSAALMIHDAPLQSSQSVRLLLR